jgi:amino acid permease
MDSVIRSALGFAALVYFSLGFCGYFSFGTVVQGNILLSYPSTILVAFARVAISLLVCICYPLQQKPGRDSFLGLLRMSTTLAWRESATSRGTYIGFTSTYLALSYAVAMSVVNYPSALNVIISLLGSTTSTLIA